MNNPTEDNIKIIFGLKVKKLRAQKGYTFHQLAEKCGISVSYLNEIENGKKYPKGEKITELAKAPKWEFRGRQTACGNPIGRRWVVTSGGGSPFLRSRAPVRYNFCINGGTP